MAALKAPVGLQDEQQTTAPLEDSQSMRERRCATATATKAKRLGTSVAMATKANHLGTSVATATKAKHL